MTDLIEIDGSALEGGGAILRVASALSAVTGKPIHIFNIRRVRKRPGLRMQHLEGLKAVAELCNGKLKGAKLDSTEIWFYPKKIQAKELSISILTAGSTGLIFQILKLPVSQAEGEVKINIKGGAVFGKFAPPLLSSKNILLPVLEKIGYRAEINILKHGFYPVGGSSVKITVRPCKEFKPLVLTERGEIESIEGISIASKYLEKAKVAERQAKTVKEILENSGFSPKIKTGYVDAKCPGSGIVLWAKTSLGCILGSDSIGERGKPSEKIGKEVAQDLLKTIASEATVDKHISDQVLIFLAMTKGKSIIVAPELTNHAKTNIWVIEKFLGKRFSTEEISGGVKISCSGS